MPPAGRTVRSSGCRRRPNGTPQDGLRRLAREIEGEPPARTGSPHVLSGLVSCRCGARMSAVKNYVTTKRGRHPLVYYRCRRASHKGTCDERQISAAVLEPTVIVQLEAHRLNQARLRALVTAAVASFDAEAKPLLDRRAALARELQRVDRRERVLLELIEDRVITREEFAKRRQLLQSDRVSVTTALEDATGELRDRVVAVGLEQAVVVVG